jgi:hypothetical protein
MSWSFVLSVATMFAVPLAAGVATAHATPASSVLDPVTHENLSVYFVRGQSATGPVPLTLQEAILKGSVNVHETGQVNELIIENTGTDDVFVQAGDIVKGGKQDRVLTVSLLIPSGAGKIPIGAYCVEQGRWSPRGVEDAKRFSSSEKSVPSREAKLAMLAPAQPARPRTDEPSQSSMQVAREPNRIMNRGQHRGEAAAPSRQSAVWAQVAKIQDSLSARVNERVNSGVSASSLQLSLENQKLAETRARYVETLKAAAKDPEIVGVVIAINGQISSADIYPSNGLFKKMWPKLLDAAATEAIGTSKSEQTAAPEIASVQSFLAAADKGKPAATPDLASALMNQEIRDGDKSLVVESRRKDGGFVHRTYLAK